MAEFCGSRVVRLPDGVESFLAHGLDLDPPVVGAGAGGLGAGAKAARAVETPPREKLAAFIGRYTERNICPRADMLKAGFWELRTVWGPYS